MLTSSVGSDVIWFADGSTYHLWKSMRDPSWSPDGSRAVFVDDENRVQTLRYNDNSHTLLLAESLDEKPPPNTWRSDPVYAGDGGAVFWTAATGDGPSRIERTRSTCCTGFTRVSPSDGMSYTNPDASDSSTVVVQRQRFNEDPDIGFLRDGSYTPLVAGATNPAISPDGTKIAYIYYGQVWVCDTEGNNRVQVTDTIQPHYDPVWSPDGKTVAFTEAAEVATVLADGSQATKPTIVPNLYGSPAYQPRRKEQVVRLAGADRFGTAANVSQSHWANTGDGTDTRVQAESVVLSRSDTFADALGGSALAAAKQGPLLMTPPTALDATTQAEIQRVLAPGKTVYLLGSVGALSQAVQDQVEALGYHTERIFGPDRFATSIAIADAIDPNPGLVMAATGMDFPDALAAGAAAGSYDVPGMSPAAVVVLTNNATLPPATRSYLDAHRDADTFGIGLQGYNALTAAYGTADVYKVVGKDRFETAQQAAYWFFGSVLYAGVATGMNWPDALAGGALMATLNGPLLLTNGTGKTLVPQATDVIDESSASLHTGYVFGSAAVVNAAQANGLASWMSGPLGATVTQAHSQSVAAAHTLTGPLPRPTAKAAPTQGSHPVFGPKRESDMTSTK